MAPSKDARALPPKDEALFRQILQLYEAKNFKKAVKTADQILKKHPNNGQTISLKALVLFHSPANPELRLSVADNESSGLALAKEGVRKDPESQLCWHVLGMLQRAKKEYALAGKSFAQALKADPHSQQILRDAAHLSLHLRQPAQHLTHRLTLFQLRPNERKSWHALALAYQLAGDLEGAEKVLGGLVGKGGVQRVESEGRVEEGEVREWRVRVLMQAEKWADALAALDEAVAEGQLVNQAEIGVLRAEILANLGRKDEAEDAYRALLERNADDRAAYVGFLKNRGLDVDHLTDDSRPKVLRALANFAELYPRAGTPGRLALGIAQGPEFEALVSAHAARALERGVPSLFADLKVLYGDAEKRAAVERVVEGFRESLERTGTLDGSDDHTQPPPTLLWTYYFLALHHSYPTATSPTPNTAQSLAYLSTAIAHTPTLPELYTARARVLKHAADPLGAARSMEAARELDGQDRFLNSKAGKYWLRAGEPERASAVLGLFTKKDARSPADDLVEMQGFWFALEEAQCWAGKGRLGMALKRYGQVFKMFDDLEDDEFDFHGYCLRKATFKAYLALRSVEDDLRSRPAYVKAALGAARIYVALADDAGLAGRSEGGEGKAEGVSAEEAKKAAQKAKKAAAAAAAAASNGNGKKGAASAAAAAAPTTLAVEPPKDDDPLGLALLKTSTPLDDAAKVLAPLLKPNASASARLDVQLAAYQVAVRRGKLLQAARALVRAAEIDQGSAELLVELVHFKKTVAGLTDLPEPTAAVLAATLDQLLPSVSSPADLPTFVKSSQAAHASSPNHVLAASKALYLVAPETAQNDVEPLLCSLVSADQQPTTTVDQALEGLRVLETIGSARIDEYRQLARSRWAVARVFDADDDKAAARDQWLADERALKDKRAAVDEQQ